MIRSYDQLLTWLRGHCRHDRVVFNALNQNPRQVTITPDLPGGWGIKIVSHRGGEYRLVVVQHPVTGDPERWYRVNDEEAELS